MISNFQVEPLLLRDQLYTNITIWTLSLLQTKFLKTPVMLASWALLVFTARPLASETFALFKLESIVPSYIHSCNPSKKRQKNILHNTENNTLISLSCSNSSAKLTQNSHYFLSMMMRMLWILIPQLLCKILWILAIVLKFLTNGLQYQSVHR